MNDDPAYSDINARIEAQLAEPEPDLLDLDLALHDDDQVPHPAEHEAVQPAEAVERRAQEIIGSLLTTAQLADIPEPVPLVEGLLYRDSLALLYGPSGVGKSFVAIDLAMSVASDREWWNACRVESGTVLYIVAEGVPGVNARAKAWETHHGPSHGVMWRPQAVDLFDPVWSHSLAVAAARLRPALIVIDTLARSEGAARENATEDMNRIVDHLDRIRLASGACVLCVHHTGKEAASGARGSSTLKAAMDTEIELSGDIHTATKIKNTKQKNAGELDPFQVRLELVEGTKSGVPVTTSGNDPDSASKRLSNALPTLAVLREIGVPGGVSSTAWKAACDCSERQFYRHRAALVDSGMVADVSPGKTTLYQVVSE